MSIYFQCTISVNTFGLGFYVHALIPMNPYIPLFPTNPNTPNITLSHKDLLRIFGFDKSEVLKYILVERVHV